MPAAPRGQYLVPFVLMGCSAVLRFWLATALADLKRRKNDPAQQAVGIDRIGRPVERSVLFSVFRGVRDAPRVWWPIRYFSFGCTRLWLPS